MCTCTGGTAALATDGNCETHAAEDCTACKAGYGYVDVNSTCEECQENGHPEYNNATDNSPCGQHTACTIGERFEFSNSSGKDRCVACATGTDNSKPSHFDTLCEDNAVCSSITCATGWAADSTKNDTKCARLECNTNNETGTDNDLCCNACTDTHCDVCNGDVSTCTYCSDSYILNVSGTCVNACPTAEYGVVDTDLQCKACAAIMDGIDGVRDGSCTDCDGPAATNCAAATCETGYHTFADGAGCSGG